ncbi:hypothetical protein SD70_23520 [Gordoniibacillus kamchatkensis]|uniref:Uncharacterized protein n=1 Tax=Gordoniibacillus kamchatkensis TaxID=1590651 RepID=A0ABR5ACY5_9BACL|nr:hypothetical protein [Paenibacillus sp. VKM B-2647]KIL38921.1 hypothetical protein SD70_23520 [Paenibacillus sp. VKM B-2647]
MLLYQMSQLLNERQRLQRELRSQDGDAANALQSQIQELEERLYGPAREWLASTQASAPQDVPANAYEPPVLTSPELGLQ